MKYIFFFLCIPYALSALPFNNPAAPGLTCEGVVFDQRCVTPMTNCDTISARIGYYGDFIFNNHLQLDGREGTIRRASVMTNAGEIDLNFWNWIDLFAVLGVSSIEIQSTQLNFFFSGTPLNGILVIAPETYFSWSLGGRVLLWRWGRFLFGAEGQYFSTAPQINYVQDNLNSVPYYQDDASLKYQAWQVGIGVTMEMPINPCFTFLPYAGFIGSGAHVDMNNLRVTSSGGTTWELYDLNKDRPIGYAIGGTLVGGERLMITAEGRYAYEKALFLSVQFRM